MEAIKTNSDGIIEVELHDYNDKPTGKKWIFDTEDITLPLRYQESAVKIKEVEQWYKGQMLLLDKKQDVLENGFMSKKQIEMYKIIEEYYKRMMEAYDLFLGKDGCSNYLNGRNPYYTMFADINEGIEPILPQIKISIEGVKDKIKNKYNVKEDDVLE